MASITPIEQCQLPEEYEYKLLEFEEKQGNNCTISFRIKNIKTEEDAEKWLKDYEEKSKLTWRKSRAVKASGKINIFRRDLRCQHNTDVRHRSKGKRVTKNTNCPATMKIVINRFTDEPNLRKIDDETKLFPCVVNLHNWHNQMLNSASVLRFRDISTDTKEKLLEYFQTGHTAASARNALQTELMLQSPDDFSVLAADSSILPSLSTIQHLYNNSFKNTCRSRKELNTFEDVQNLIADFNNANKGKAAIDIVNSHIIIALSTTIMLRTIENLPQTKELILVDTSGHMDALNHRIYFFLVPTVAGGAPIGCIITDSKKEVIFRAGVNLLKTCLPDSFVGPKVFMVDGDIKEQKILKEIFPDSKQLLCQLHVLTTVWQWLSNPTHGVPNEERPGCYSQMKSLVYAETEEIFNEKLYLLISSVTNEKLLNYIKNLLNTKEMWGSCFRTGLPIRSNTNNDVEVSFKILKDNILDMVKAPNVVQLIHFIIEKYELYLKKRYLDFSCGKNQLNLDSKYWYSDELKRTMFKIATGKGPSEDFLKPITYNPNVPPKPSTSEIYHTAVEDISNTVEFITEMEEDLASENVDGKEELKKQIQNWAEELCRGVDEDSEIFIPAIKEMMKNRKNFCATKAGAISALCNFGKIQGPKALSVNGKRKGVKSIQPTAIARRKLPLSGKRKMAASYTNFGPHPKKKAPHN